MLIGEASRYGWCNAKIIIRRSPGELSHGDIISPVPSNRASEEGERFAWIDTSAIQETVCLSFVRNTDVDRVAKAFEAVRDHARTLAFDEFCEKAFAHYENQP